MALMTLGLVYTIDHKVFGMTDAQRFHKGWTDAPFPVKHTLTYAFKVMDTSAFRGHTPAYQNGFIAAIDYGYGLSIPFYNYDYKNGTLLTFLLHEHNHLVFAPGNFTSSDLKGYQDAYKIDMNI